jgi:NAD(P)-dependent dehydrogenase (short-subunit alcohol dehydrogenase family)
MAGQFDGKVALVTGGSSGIGRATAQEFARRGAKVAIADIDESGAQKTVDAIKALGAEVLSIRADVTSSADIQNMINKTVETFGRLDIAHNNAGIDGDFATLVSGTEENFDHVIAVNLKSVWLGLKYEIPVMRKQGGGVIVNSASVAGLVAFRTMAPYTASKHGVVGLTKAAALECSRIGIRVNAICPGAIRTAMIDAYIAGNDETERFMSGLQPIGRMGNPEEVANLVAWLCSDEASFVTGAAIPIDGGIVSQSGDFPPVPPEE